MYKIITGKSSNFTDCIQFYLVYYQTGLDVNNYDRSSVELNVCAVDFYFVYESLSTKLQSSQKIPVILQ